MDLYRYINNTSTDIVSTIYTVPAWDQLMSLVDIPELDAITTLVVLVNGVAQPPNQTQAEIVKEQVPNLDLDQDVKIVYPK